MHTSDLKQELINNIKLALSRMDLNYFRSILPNEFPLDHEPSFFREENVTEYIPEKPIDKLESTLNNFIERGDSELAVTEGICHSCFKGQLGLRMTGKTSGRTSNYVLAFNEQNEMIAFQFCRHMACGNEAETEEFQKQLGMPF